MESIRGLDDWIVNGGREDNRSSYWRILCEGCEETFYSAGHLSYGWVELNEESCPHCGSTEYEIIEEDPDY